MSTTIDSLDIGKRGTCTYESVHRFTYILEYMYIATEDLPRTTLIVPCAVTSARYAKRMVHGCVGLPSFPHHPRATACSMY